MVVEYNQAKEMDSRDEERNDEVQGEHSQPDVEHSERDIVNRNDVPRESVLGRIIQGMQKVMDGDEHHSLRNDLVEHLWSQKGRHL